MKNKITTLTLGMMIACGANAAGPPVPHSFTAGQKAVASEVNENFQNLADRIDAVPGAAVLDESNYVHSATTKIFSVSNVLSPSADCSNETRTYARSTNGATKVITETFVVTGASGPCAYLVRTFERDSAGLRFVKSDNYSSDGTTLVSTSVDGRVLVPGKLNLGFPWTNAIVGTVTPVIGTPSNYIYFEENKVIAVEGITVTAGTFGNCLKIFATYNAGGSPPSAVTRFEWRCEGAGLVKQMYSTGLIRELVSITP